MNRKRPLDIRSLNMPRPVHVTENAHGAPASIAGRPVARVIDRWRIDDEWWRESPISRMYYEIELEDGRRWTGFKDLVSGEWFEQRV